MSQTSPVAGGFGRVLRELVAVMPIVVLFKAVRQARAAR